jgi:hypothetical protein
MGAYLISWALILLCVALSTNFTTTKGLITVIGTPLSTAKGGRQGCKLGSTILSSGYAIALQPL